MAEKLIHLNSSNFDSTVASKKATLVDFWAPWCGPCRMLGPTIDALAEEMGDTAQICKVNVDENPDLAEKFGIMQIPTIIIFKHGKIVETCHAQSKEALKEKILHA